MAEISRSESSTQFSPYVQKMIDDYLAQAKGLSTQPYVPYPGQRVAPLTPQHQAAIDAIQRRATEGAPDLNAARSMTTDFTGGKYLNNPYLGENSQYTQSVIADNAANMGRAFATGTAAQNDAAANRQGAYGGSGWLNKQAADAEGLARATGQMANQYQLARTSLGAGDYRSGTGQMLTAGQLAGNLAQDDWRAAQMLAGAGDIGRDVSQQGLDAQYQEFLRQQRFPYEQANAFGTAIGNVAGGQGTTTTTQSQPNSSDWLNWGGLGLVGIGGLLDYFNKP